MPPTEVPLLGVTAELPDLGVVPRPRCERGGLSSTLAWLRVETGGEAACEGDRPDLGTSLPLRGVRLPRRTWARRPDCLAMSCGAGRTGGARDGGEGSAPPLLARLLAPDGESGKEAAGESSYLSPTFTGVWLFMSARPQARTGMGCGRRLSPRRLPLPGRAPLPGRWRCTLPSSSGVRAGRGCRCMGVWAMRCVALTCEPAPPPPRFCLRRPALAMGEKYAGLPALVPSDEDGAVVARSLGVVPMVWGFMPLSRVRGRAFMTMCA